MGKGVSVIFSCWRFCLPGLDPGHPTSRHAGITDSLFRRWYRDTSSILQEGSLGLPVERRMWSLSWKPNHKHVSRALSLVAAQVHEGEWKRQGTFVKMMWPHMQKQFHNVCGICHLCSKEEKLFPVYLESSPLERESVHPLPGSGVLGEPFNLNEPQFPHL